MLKGVDVSEWQTGVNWQQAASELQFASVRSSYGPWHCDLMGPYHRTQARNHGVALLHTHCAVPDQSDPLTQVEIALDAAGAAQPGEPFALDIEQNYPELVGWVLGWAVPMKERTGKPPLLYMNQNILASYDWSPLVKLDCGLWLAVLDTEAAPPADIGPWSVCAIKQHTEGGTAFGFSGPVDLDVFYGDLGQFRLYGPGVQSVAGEPSSDS